jgi:hypothetical protein
MEELKPVEFIEGYSPEDPKTDNSGGSVELAAPAVIKKKTAGKKLFDKFFLGDLKTIFEYLINDKFIPFVKSSAEDVFHMILYGGRGSGNKPSRRYDSEYDYSPITSVSYSDYYDKQNKKRERPYEVYEYDEIYLRTKDDAINVIRMLKEKILYEGCASVLDLYTIVKQSTVYVANYYGWQELPKPAEEYIVYSRGLYLLRLPKPLPLDRKRRD